MLLEIAHKDSRSSSVKHRQSARFVDVLNIYIQYPALISRDYIVLSDISLTIDFVRSRRL